MLILLNIICNIYPNLPAKSLMLSFCMCVCECVRVCRTNKIKYFLKKQMKSNQNAPGIKKERLRTKTGFAEKGVKSNGWQKLPCFNRFESFGQDDLTAKHCYVRCSRPPDVDEVKIFDKDDQTTKRCSFSLNVLRPGHLYQNF